MSKGKSGGGFSYKKEDFTDGGGIDGALATITEIGFVEGFTYGGRHKDKPSIALRTEYKIDGFDKPWEDHWPVGDETKYELVNDGDGVRSLGKAVGLNRKSGAAFFFEALQDAIEASGLDYDDIVPEIDGEDGVRSIRELEGRQVRLASKPFTNVSGDTKDKVVIAGFEEDAPARGKSKSNGKANGKSKGGDDVEAKTEQIVVGLLDAAKGNTLKKSNLSNAVYEDNRKDSDVKAMMALAFKDAWVYDDARPWDSDRKKGTLTARE
jgi:hypothetical protein